MKSETKKVKKGGEVELSDKQLKILTEIIGKKAKLQEEFNILTKEEATVLSLIKEFNKLPEGTDIVGINGNKLEYDAK